MKTKYSILILSAIILAGSTVKAQIADMRDFRNEDARIVVNNYYDDYDYYFSSRINRFHRSYSAFNYYAPVFTDTYWYNYQPYSWGVSIYGGGGFGLGYSNSYPVYSYGYGYNNGWSNPYSGSSYYWGYDPFYYNSWYSPVVINIRVRSRWSNNYGWNGHNHGYNDYRPVYNTYNNNYNNYPSTRYSSGSYSSRRTSTSNPGNSVNFDSRRQSTSISSTSNETNRNNSNNINNGIPHNNGNNVNSGNNGNNGDRRNNGNGVTNGNNGNNDGKGGTNSNIYNGNNNVNRTNTSTGVRRTVPVNNQVNRSVVQPSNTGRTNAVSNGNGSTQSRTVSTPARSTSSSSRSGTSVSQSKSSSSKSTSKSATTQSSSGSKPTRRK